MSLFTVTKKCGREIRASEQSSQNRLLCPSPAALVVIMALRSSGLPELSSSSSASSALCLRRSVSIRIFLQLLLWHLVDQLFFHHQPSCPSRAPRWTTPRTGSMVCAPCPTWAPWCPVTLPSSMSTTQRRSGPSQCRLTVKLPFTIVMSTDVLSMQVLGKSCKPIPGKHLWCLIRHLLPSACVSWKQGHFLTVGVETRWQ